MKPSGRSQRQLRVGEQVRHVLAQVLLRGDLTDPVIANSVISLSEVHMSPDLKWATCYVIPVGNTNSAEVVDGLNSHARYLRGEVSKQLRQLKSSPQLQFRVDTSFDNYSRIDSLLKSPVVARDLKEQNDE